MRAGIIAFLLMVPGLLCAQSITSAQYADPTTRYQHGVLGDDIEWGALVLGLSTGQRLRITLPDQRVFEDLAPRLADVDGDGLPEVVVVETHVDFGARLSVYDETGLVTATPYIGQRNRWLSPIGIEDFDGDGQVEIAYIDRPHLAKTLRLWRFDLNRRKLVHLADAAGLTNHKIGWDFIAGGVRGCAKRPEMIVARADWSSAISVTYRDGQFTQTELDIATTPDAMACALYCEDRQK